MLPDRTIRLVRHAGRAVLDVLLPPTCLTCDAPVTQPGQFCAACFRETRFVAEPQCRLCAVPFASAAQAGPDRLCLTCCDHPPAWDRAAAALVYDRQSRKLVLPFKHGDRIELAPALAAHMARVGAALLRDAELIVPVPLHPSRLRRRGYNQAALLAAALSRRSGVPALLDGLQRLRRTTPLGTTGAEARAAELAGAFAVRPRRAGRIDGRRVLLVDDVLTSGATANACTRALRLGGATGVDVLVAARVPAPRS